MLLESQIFGNKKLIQDKQKIVITFGNFDGVHAGHRHLIKEMKKHSGGLPLVVVTFNPHPVTFFNPDKPKELLTTQEDKISLLLAENVDAVVVQKFDENFANLSADD